MHSKRGRLLANAKGKQKKGKGELRDDDVINISQVFIRDWNNFVM